MNFNIAKNSIKFAKGFIGKSVFKIKKYSPEIFFGIGIVAVIGGTILTAKETLNLNDILDEAEKEKKEANGDKKEEAKATIKLMGKLALNYLPGSAAVLGGLGCMGVGFGFKSSRLSGYAASYEALSASYKALKEKYPEGVIEKGKVKLGGEKEKIEVDILPEDPNLCSPYARFFDEFSTCWRKDPEYNMVFLKAQQNYANDLLRARKHLFLNEVYDMLGIPRSQQGQFVGWLYDENGDGDNFVDFGLYDGDRERVRAFINGYERSILLDFNVDGLIYDKLDDSNENEDVKKTRFF